MKLEIKESEINDIIKEYFGPSNVMRMTAIQRGVPDLLIACCGTHFVEVKTQTARITKLQQRFLKKFGGYIYRFNETKPSIIKSYFDHGIKSFDRPKDDNLYCMSDHLFKVDDILRNKLKKRKAGWWLEK